MVACLLMTSGDSGCNFVTSSVFRSCSINPFFDILGVFQATWAVQASRTRDDGSLRAFANALGIARGGFAQRSSGALQQCLSSCVSSSATGRVWRSPCAASMVSERHGGRVGITLSFTVAHSAPLGGAPNARVQDRRDGLDDPLRRIRRSYGRVSHSRLTSSVADIRHFSKI